MSPFQIDPLAKAPQTTPRKLALLMSSPLGLFGSEVWVRRCALDGDLDSAAPSGSASLLPNLGSRPHDRRYATKGPLPSLSWSPPPEALASGPDNVFGEGQAPPQ